jgi:von Willebrand factor type A domain
MKQFGHVAAPACLRAGSQSSANGSGTPPDLDLSGKGSASGTGGPNGSGTATSCQPTADSSGCVGEQFAGEGVPLDVYILFDQSCSMSCPISRGGPGQCCMGGPDPRIAPVRQAMNQFLHDSKSTNISFGIGYFGAQPVGSARCDAAFYERPAVAIGPEQADTIVASLDAVQPTGETPTGAALRGACHYAQQDKHAAPGHSVVILLVTDGIPETPVTKCGATLPDAVQAASACAGDAQTPIKTYVLGVGQALSNLNQIAAAG